MHPFSPTRPAAALENTVQRLANQAHAETDRSAPAVEPKPCKQRSFLDLMNKLISKLRKRNPQVNLPDYPTTSRREGHEASHGVSMQSGNRGNGSPELTDFCYLTTDWSSRSATSQRSKGGEKSLIKHPSLPAPSIVDPHRKEAQARAAFSSDGCAQRAPSEPLITRPNNVPQLPFAIRMPNVATLPTPLTDTQTLHELLGIVLKERPTGLQQSHLQTMLGLCREFDLIIGIRPVSHLASYLIGKLELPTKPFAIKEKTQRSGPAAGYLLADKENAAARVLPLLLTGERINELIQHKLIQPDPGNPPICNNSRNTHTERLSFLDPANMKSFVVNRLTDASDTYMSGFEDFGGIWAVHNARGPNKPNEPGKRVLVLGHPRLEKPYTADYDLLTFGTRSEDGSSPLNSQPPIDVESLSNLALARRALSGKASMEIGTSPEMATQPAPQEDRFWGNVSPLLRNLAECINVCINRGGDEDLRLIHHNADCHNPFSSESSIYPALFLLPNPKAMSRQELLAKAGANASEIMSAVHELNGGSMSTPQTHEWNNWGAVWVDSPVKFNQLASTARRFGYVIKKSQAWLGGEIVPGSNSSGGFR